MVRSNRRYRAADLWLADGKAQGWSPRTLKDRRQAMERFCWWIEHEEEIPATLAARILLAAPPRPVRCVALLASASIRVSIFSTTGMRVAPAGKLLGRRTRLAMNPVILNPSFDSG